MPLAYDFDMTSAGACWRDPAVLRALQRADPVVRAYFQSSGFATEIYDSGAPPGRYPAKDEAARADIIGQLTDNVHTVDVEGLNWGGFNLRDFLTYLGSATPVELPEPVTPDKAPPPPPIHIAEPDLGLDIDREELRRAMQPSKRKAFAMMGLAIGVILVAIAALMALP